MAATMQCHSLLGEASQSAQMMGHKRAIALCQEVLQLCCDITVEGERRMMEATALSTLGLVYQEKWADREAVQFHEEVLDIASDMNSSAGFGNLEAATLSHLARLYRATGQDHLVYGESVEQTARIGESEICMRPIRSFSWQ